MVKTIHHSHKNIKMFFYSDNHTYIDEFNNKYTSVSEWVTNYFEKFDSEKIAERCALKRNVTKESLLQEWKQKGEFAANQGTIVHDMIACKLLEKKFEINDTNIDIYTKYVNQVDILCKKINKQLDIVYIEHIIFDPEQLIAGTVDAVFITKDKSKYVILDWKTSKKIEKINYYNKWGKYPFNHLPDCNYSHYYLQLSLYKNILKNQKYLNELPISKSIVHMTPESCIQIIV